MADIVANPSPSPLGRKKERPSSNRHLLRYFSIQGGSAEGRWQTNWRESDADSDGEESRVRYVVSKCRVVTLVTANTLAMNLDDVGRTSDSS
jgi:hypothetical protein